MIRNAAETQTFFSWHDDVPYLITWTPGTNYGTLEGRVADEDFAALASTPWSINIPMATAAVALEQLASVNVQMHHDADCAARVYSHFPAA